MPLELGGVLLADRPAARRLPGLVDRLAASRDQIMPVGQGLSRCAQAVGTGLGQPVELVEILAVDLHAIGHPLISMLVIEAATVGAVEQLARDIGRVKQPRLLVLELVDAAPAATIA